MNNARTGKGLRITTIACLALFAAACDSGPDTEAGTGNGGGGKADTPQDAADFCIELECADLVNISMGQDLLHADFVRWPAGDRDGVTGPEIEQTESGLRAVGSDDRGQEYNEYFAILDLDLFGEDPTGDADPLVIGRSVCQGRDFCRDPKAQRYWFNPAEDLDEDQREWLAEEDNEDEVVGSCIFTGWHWDTKAEPKNRDVPDVHGVPATWDNFHMYGQFNNNRAAEQLVFDGLTKVASGVKSLRERAEELESRPGELASTNAAYGTCLATNDTFAGVPWRFSDGHAVTTPTALLGDCGCYAQVGENKITDPRAIANIVIPDGGEMAYDSPILQGGFLRGFPIGTWSSPTELPQGCEYVPVDNEDPQLDSRILVKCEITAGELSGPEGNLTTAQLDLKEHCRTRDRQGFNIVVHIPLPAAAIQCEPGDDAPAHCFEADGETPRKTPWDAEGVANSVEVTKGDLDLRPGGSSCEVRASDTTTRAGEEG